MDIERYEIIGQGNNVEDITAVLKDTPTPMDHEVKEMAVVVNETPDARDQHDSIRYRRLDTARPWKPGVLSRFPIFGGIAIFLVICSCLGILLVIALSDGQDYDSWCRIRYRYPGLFLKDRVLIKPSDIDYTITINIWISIFSFICGKLLALAFIEAVIINWWVRVLDGKTVRQLSHDYESSRSVFAILQNLKLFNWLCFCSIIYTVFGVVGPILQKSRTLATKSKLAFRMEDGAYSSSSITALHANMTTEFPVNASATLDSKGNIVDVNWLPINTVDAYIGRHDVVVKVDGCKQVNPFRTLSECTGTFQTLGFDYDCNDTVTSIQYKENGVYNYFSTSFTYNYDLKAIVLQYSYKNSSECYGNVIRTRTCKLIPAPVWVDIRFRMLNAEIHPEPRNETSFEGTYMGSRYFKGEAPYPPENTLEGKYNLAKTSWATQFILYQNESGVGYLETNSENVLVRDRKSKWSNGVSGTPKHFKIEDKDVVATLGGLASALRSGLSASFDAYEPKGDAAWRYSTTGNTIPTFILRNYNSDEKTCTSTFQDPSARIADVIQRIMFKYSMLTTVIDTENDWYSYVASRWEKPPYEYVSSINITALAEGIATPFYDYYDFSTTVYHTDLSLLGVAVAIMFINILCIFTLFHGYWRLGRRVTLSPFEMSQALRYQDDPSVPIHRGEATNAELEELLDLVGDVKVKYGESAPNILGLDVHDKVQRPRRGNLYI